MYDPIAAKKYYQENKKKILERSRERRKDHKIRRRDHLSVIRCRASWKGWEFTLTEDDIDWVTHCPLLGIELNYFSNRNADNSPSIDRIDPTKGYTRENTWVVSRKANSMKSNATLEELQMLVKNLETTLKKT